MEHYEAIIIGFGKGGKTLAAALADRGQKVAMIEQSKMMYGGTCINIGCIPTKSLVHHSNLSRLKKLSSFEEKAAEYHSAIDKKTSLIDALRQKNFENLDKKEAVMLYSGKVSFTSQHEISVQTENGAISLYAGFGSEVIVLDSHRDLLEREDRDTAQAVRNTLEKRGVDFRYGATIQSVIDTEHETVVTYMEAGRAMQVSADAVLVAAGRKPNIDGLQLSSAGIAITDRGAIQVNENLQTTVPHIFAMGDVTGGLQFTYISLDDQRIIMDHLYGHKSRTTRDRKFVPYSVFIDPPLSRVGLTEQEAIAKGYEVKIAVLQAAAIPRAKLSEETEGLLKAVVDAQTDLILGCSLFCADSHEMINIVQIAMQTGQPYTFLRDHIFTHPSMSESLNDLFQLISH